MRKLMMLAATMALALVVFAPAALGQPTEAKIDEDVFSQAEKGKATAKAGGTEAKAEPCPEGAAAKSGDVEAKAPCPPKMPPPPPPVMPPPPPPMMPPPPPAKMLPPSGGAGTASLLGLGAGALLVGGGLLARRLLR